MKSSPVIRDRYHFALIFLIAIFLSPTSSYSEDRGYEPIAVYLTWQHNPCTTMTINWITEPGKEENGISYMELEGKEWKTVQGSHFPMPRNEPYLIHRAELTSLIPGKPYIFRINNWEAAKYKFRTMPISLGQPFRFVAGGDMYHDGLEYVIDTNKQAAKMDPMFALVGGDIAYAASYKPNKPKKDECSRWMRWVLAWKNNMVTPEGYLIPVIPAIGNHDVNGSYNQPKEQAAFFYALFPFPGNQGYNVLDFGDYMSIFVLDTGHTTPIEGEQTGWLYHALAERKDIPHKFALYHVPAFPAVRRFNGSDHLKIRKNWVPAFDRFALAAAFENHDHVYKRSKPILNGKIDPGGVLYLGDGAWGVQKTRRPSNGGKLWYLANTKRDRHFILVTINGNHRFYYGMKPNGDIFDSYVQIKTE